MIVDERYQAAEKLFEELKERFPEVELVGIGPSPETDDLTVVKVVLPDDDEREEALSEFAANRATDILLETGDYIIVVSGLYEVWIEFHSAPPRSRQEYQQMFTALQEFIQSKGAGRMGSITFRDVHPTPVLVGWLRDLDFARDEVVGLLDRLGVLGEVELFWEHPYQACDNRRSDRTRLYPPEPEE